jgi:hypothetical protein
VAERPLPQTTFSASLFQVRSPSSSSCSRPLCVALVGFDFSRSEAGAFTLAMVSVVDCWGAGRSTVGGSRKVVDLQILMGGLGLD